MAEKKYKVATYGSLRKGLSNHRYVQNAEYLGRFETPPKYTMYSINLAFPGLKRVGTTSIVMEVYEVDEKELDAINALEGYHPDVEGMKNHYNRFEIDTPFGKAYCYEYNQPVTNLYRVDSGDWTAYKTNHQVLK